MKIDGEQCIIEAQEEKVCFFGKVVEILFSADADGE